MKSKFDPLFLPFIYLLILPILDSTFKDYSGGGQYELSLKNYISIFIVSVIVLICFVLYYSREKDKLVKIAKSFAYAVFFSFALVFYVSIVKDQTLFYLNKSYAKEKIIEEFKVFVKWSNKKENMVGIKSVFNDYYFTTENKFTPNEFSKMEEGDTLKIKMGIGLLNRPFLYSGNIEIIE